jgi:2-C-methyl-D-erythritol 4-phosphate cytidylyltransferase
MKQAKRPNRDISIIIPAAGIGKRMRSEAESRFSSGHGGSRKHSVRKPFIRLKGKPLLIHIINKFVALPRLREIIIAINPQDMEKAGKLVSIYVKRQGIAIFHEQNPPLRFAPRDDRESLPDRAGRRTSYGAWVKKAGIKLVKGGNERRDSVARALKAVDKASRVVLVHDVARPLVDKGDIDTLIKAVRRFGAAILAVPVVDTIKMADKSGYILKTLKRAQLWAAQTPQGFKKDILEKAYSKLEFVADKHIITDDASLAENAGYRVRIVRGSYDNIKITTLGDLEIIKEKL